MKTILNSSKLMIIISFLLLGMQLYAQSTSKSYKGFLRVYSQSGEMITKGRFMFVNDSVLGIKKNKEVNTVNSAVIGYIKTKRSGGHNVLIGAATGGAIGVAVGIGTADPDAWIFGYTAGEGALVFGTLGALGGGLLGGLIALFKEPALFIISGNEQNWQEFKKFLEGRLEIR